MGIERRSWPKCTSDINSQNPGENCPFNPQKRGKEGSCRRGVCKYFGNCPEGRRLLKPGDEIISSPLPDSRAGNVAGFD